MQRIPTPPRFSNLDDIWSYLFQIVQLLNLEQNTVEEIRRQIEELKKRG